MDFNASPIGVFVTTKLIYVATLKLTYLLLDCYNIEPLIPMSLCRDKVYECRDISKASMS